MGKVIALISLTGQIFQKVVSLFQNEIKQFQEGNMWIIC